MSTELIGLARRVTATRFPGLVPVGVAARRAVRGGVIWGAVFGLMTLAIVNEFVEQYPTAEDRVRLVETMGTDAGSRAIFGPAHHLDTVAGYEAYHVLAIFGIVGAVWGLLTSTRLLRGEEDAGRWEIVLAGQTTRRRAAAGAVAGLGVGLLTFWAVSAAAAVAIGRNADPPFSVSGSLFLAVATVATAGMFLAVGAVCSQLAASRRQAAMLAAVVLGVAYLIRVFAYSSTSLRWMRWFTPLGWVDELRPLTGSRQGPLVLIVGFTAVLTTVAIVVAGTRDLGAGVVPAHDTAAPRTRSLNGPLGLAYRLNIRTALGWITSLAIGGFVLGLSVNSIEDIWADQAGGVVQRLGGATGANAYLGLIFLIVALLVAMFAASQVGATREEEAEGYLDHLLARPVPRLRWLAGRFVVSAAALMLAGVSSALFTWVSAASTGADVRLPTLLAAGVNVVPIGIFVLGIGTLVHGLAPRFAAIVAYGLVAWSFLVEIVGASLGVSRWLLDLSVLHHVARAPAVDPRWDSAVILLGLGTAAAALGAAVFIRRDLKGA